MNRGPNRSVGSALIVVLSIVSIIGMRESTWITVAFTLIEIGGLVLVVWLGMHDPQFGERAFSELGPEVLPGAALVFFSFLGFEEIANLAEEARDPGRGTPVFASLAACGLALLLLPAGGLELIASLSSFGALTAFVAVNACVLLLRYKQPKRKRPFRVPLSIGRFALLPTLGIVTTLALLASFDGPIYLGGAIAVILGLIMHALTRNGQHAHT